jgi:hypothetical protein
VENTVFDPFSMTSRLCSTRHFATGTPPMVGRMWALSPGLALLHRAGLFAALDAVLEVLLAEHLDGASGADVGADRGVPLSVSSAASASEEARRTPASKAPSPAGARNITWYFVPPSSGA